MSSEKSDASKKMNNPNIEADGDTKILVSLNSQYIVVFSIQKISETDIFRGNYKLGFSDISVLTFSIQIFSLDHSLFHLKNNFSQSSLFSVENYF